MKILIVDDKIDEPRIQNLIQYVLDRKKFLKYEFNTYEVKLPEEITEEEKLLRLDNIFGEIQIKCAEEDIDMVLLDLAFNNSEERQLNQVIRGERVSLNQFGGIDICAKLKGLFPDLPVAIFTKFPSGGVAQAAFDAGADHFIKKEFDQDEMIRSLQNLMVAKVRCDMPLYEALDIATAKVDSTFWRKDVLRKAMEQFFRQASPIQRFSSLCNSLLLDFTEVFSEAGEMISVLKDNLLVPQQVLTLRSQPVRDHVCHPATVFWIGYYLLNNLPQYRNLNDLPGFTPDAWSSPEEIDFFEQLNFSWMIASLFHDLGYAEEKKATVLEVLQKVYKKEVKPSERDMDKETKITATINELISFVKYKVQDSQSLEQTLTWIKDYYGKKLTLKRPPNENPDKIFIDHGVLSAVCLMELIKTLRIPKKMEPLVYHAAIAITLHNLAKWQETYKGIPDCVLKLGQLPVCNLLAFCDLFHSWDRDIPTGPTSSEVHPTNAYIGRSRIGRFVFDAGDIDRVPNLFVSVHYSMKQGENFKHVAQEFALGVQKWKTEDWANKVKQTFSLEEIISAKVDHYIPFEKMIEIKM